MRNPDGDEQTRSLQISVLHQLASRLVRGDSPLPTDVVLPLIEELQQRLDQEAIEEAWSLQGTEEAQPWVSVRTRLLI